MDHNATIPRLLNLSVLRIANDNCVRVTIVPGFADEVHRTTGAANYEVFGAGKGGVPRPTT